MSTRTTAVLAILLALLGMAYYLTEVRGGRTDPDEAKRLFAVKPEDVESVELRTAQGEIRLQRQGDAWRIEEPVQAKGDRAAIGTLVAALAGARAERTLEELPASPADFGLDRPALVARFRARGDSQWRRLEFGGKSPTGAWAYVRVDERPQVVLVAESLRGEVNKTALDLRDKSLFRYANKDVKKVRLAAGGKAVAVEREGEARWKIVEPAPGVAEEPRVTDLLFRLAGLRADGVAAEQPDRPDRYGLDRPGLTVTVTAMDGKEIGTLLVGREEGGRRYVQIKGEAPVYTIASKDLKDLPRAPEDFRPRQPAKKT